MRTDMRLLLKVALERVYSGDQTLEADALADQLDDLGVRLLGPMPDHANPRAV